MGENAAHSLQGEKEPVRWTSTIENGKVIISVERKTGDNPLERVMVAIESDDEDNDEQDLFSLTKFAKNDYQGISAMRSLQRWRT